jgi:hypothetical protein
MAWAAVYLGYLYLIYQEKSIPVHFFLFLALAFIWPYLFSRIYIQHNLKSPIEFINRKLSVSWFFGGIIVLVFVAFYTWLILQPNRISIETGERIYSERDLQFTISFLFFVIPIALLLFMFPFQLKRIAFCANGLLYQGFLFDWSNFRGYKWENEEMYRDVEANLLMEKDTVVGLTLFPGNVKPLPFVQLHYAIPYNNKETIDKILKQAFSS